MSSNGTNAGLQQSSGLPQIPKVLSIISNSVDSQWHDSAKVYAAQMAMDKEAKMNSTENLSEKSMTDQAKSMSASLALLRKEMSSLRQMDGYLLCKLMSLQSSISEFKAQEDERFSESDLILEDDEDDIDDSEIITNGRISII